MTKLSDNLLLTTCVDASATLAATDNVNRVVWQSNTARIGVPPYRMLVLDEGVAVIVDSTNRRIWSTPR
jgi:hypothetical protein